jgi:hypothetical protein
MTALRHQRGSAPPASANAVAGLCSVVNRSPSRSRKNDHIGL